MPCGGSPFGNVCVCDIIRRRGEVGVVGVVSEHQALLLTRRETTLILAKQHCGLYRHSSRPSIMGILEVGNLPRPRRALLCLGRPLAPASGFRRRGMVDRCAGGCTRGKTHDHHAGRSEEMRCGVRGGSGIWGVRSQRAVTTPSKCPGIQLFLLPRPFSALES